MSCCPPLNIEIMIEIKDKNDWKKLQESGKPFLLDFYADWCGPCQALLPILDHLSEKHGAEVTIAKVNVDKNQELAGAFGVRSIPTVFAFQNGEVVDFFQGLQPPAFVENKIEQLKLAS